VARVSPRDRRRGREPWAAFLADPSPRALTPVLAALAAAIFLLAALSPLEMGDADPAMALVAAQALVDHGTLDLGVYRGAPGLAYDLEGRNYRLRRLGGGVYYFNLGVPVVSAPAVALAGGLGYDMLDQRDELALQNLISAVCTALVFVLLYRLARFYAAPWPSLALALVTTLGSSLTSTLATGLWSTCYQAVLICLVLLLLLARRGEPVAARHLAALALLLGAGFVIRPATAFLGLAVLVYLLGERRAVSVGARLALAAAGAAVVLAAFDLLPGIPRYYSPRKVLPAAFPWQGLYGVVASPGRGLFVYSPFLVPVAAALAVYFRALLRDRLARAVALWIVLHVAGVAMKETWWGGQSYGPRLLTEIMPGFLVLAAWAWRRLAAAPARRSAWAVSYLLLGLAGAAVHSYQGLFNPAIQRWDRQPNVDDPRYHGLLFDWRYPQFLATDAAVDARWLEVRRRDLGLYRPGRELAHDSPDLLLVGWHGPEAGLRWSRGPESALGFRLGPGVAGRPGVVELHASTLGDQDVGLALNGTPLGTLRFGYEPARRTLAVPAGVLREGENTLRLEVPGAGTTPGDERVLGLALRSFTLRLS